LAEQPIKGNFDLPHLRAIHKHLFQDVYPFAGEIRTVAIQKGGSVFALPAVIESYGGQVFRELAKDNHLKGLDGHEFSDAMGRHYTELNRLHPFREGNGRSARVFLDQLATEAGYALDYRRVGGKEWNEAARESFGGSSQPIRDVFAKIAMPARAIAFERDGRDQALIKHPELAIAFAALDKAVEDARRTSADAAQLANFAQQSKSLLFEALASGKLAAAERASTPRERDLER
jgi:cell filamentation protein